MKLALHLHADGTTEPHDIALRMALFSANFELALDAHTGKVLGRCRRRHPSVEFRKFPDIMEAAVHVPLDVHLMVDNYATHKTALIRNWLAKRPWFHGHFTPIGASWLNLVERWFAALTEKQLRRGVHPSTKVLEEAIYQYLAVTNENPRPFMWTKAADEILANRMFPKGC